MQALLDRAADRQLPTPDGIASGLSERLGRRRPLSSALRGAWIGHAAHPMLTDFVEGPWMAASFLDLLGPDDTASASRRLVAVGPLAAIPTWLSGLTDWQASEGRSRRIGLVHACSSSAATVLYAAPISPVDPVSTDGVSSSGC
jgi:hypothetical protein